jgi:hypothetical protein
MTSRFFRASFVLILAGAATVAFAQGGGIGRAGTYPPQFGPGVPSHEDIVQKHNKAAPKQAVGGDSTSDAGGVSDVRAQSGASTTAAPQSGR